MAAAPALGTARHSPPNRAFLPPVRQGAPGTTAASSNGSKPMELPRTTGRGAPRPVGGSRPLPKHRGQLPLGSARLVLAALASTTSCPSHQHLTRSQSSPTCAKHGTGSSGRGQLSERPPSRISGCRAAPRSGSAGSGDWLSGHDPHRAPPRKRKFPSFYALPPLDIPVRQAKRTGRARHSYPEPTTK